MKKRTVAIDAFPLLNHHHQLVTPEHGGLFLSLQV
jgi:hypothetical protein